MTMPSVVPTFLFKTLIIPLALATALVLWISGRVGEPWAGLLVNIAAGFVGTAMTVLYVDVVLRRYGDAQWKAVEQRVNTRVEGLARFTISSVGIALRIESAGADGGGDIAAQRRSMIEFAEGRLTREVGAIRTLDVKGWKSLAVHLKSAANLADRLLATFSPRLTPDITDEILNLQDVISAMLAAHAVNELAAKLDGSPLIPAQPSQYAQAETDVRQLLAVAARLLRSLDGGDKARRPHVGP